MDAATIQARIDYGRGKVALYIGSSCALFRPLTATAPLGNQLTGLDAAFNAADPAYTKPQVYGKSVWYADLDGSQTLPGDYLIRLSDGAIWFIAAQQLLLPIIAIECNRKIRLSRAAAVNAKGALGYSGIVDPPVILGSSTGSDIALGALSIDGSMWPASILQGGRSTPSVGLPADVKSAAWKILLPPSVPINIESDDFFSDDLGRRFAIESAELSDLGWRLTGNEVHT